MIALPHSFHVSGAECTIGANAFIHSMHIYLLSACVVLGTECFSGLWGYNSERDRVPALLEFVSFDVKVACFVVNHNDRDKKIIPLVVNIAQKTI